MEAFLERFMTRFISDHFSELYRTHETLGKD